MRASRVVAAAFLIAIPLSLPAQLAPGAPRSPSPCRPPGPETLAGITDLQRWVASESPTTRDLLRKLGIEAIRPDDITIVADTLRCRQGWNALALVERARGAPAPTDSSVWLFRMGMHFVVDWVHACDSEWRPVAVFDSGWRFRGYLSRGVIEGRPCARRPGESGRSGPPAG